MPTPKVTLPPETLTTLQVKPLPMFGKAGVSVIGCEQIRMAPLWMVPSSVVLMLISTTGRRYVCSLPLIQVQTVAKVWASIVLEPWPTQNRSVSDAGAAVLATSIVMPSSRFA